MFGRHRCVTFLCSGCQQKLCQLCSVAELTLPMSGDNSAEPLELRVCESCYERGTLPAADFFSDPCKKGSLVQQPEENELQEEKEKEEEDAQLASALSQSEIESKTAAKKKLKEDEDTQLALALSRSEAESKIQRESASRTNSSVVSSQANSAQEFRDQITCLICATARRSHAPTVCHHLSLCIACVDTLMSLERSQRKCPICQRRLRDVSDWTEIYF